MANPRTRFIRGQARILEAIAATIIILVLAALMPVIFNSPTTTLKSQVQTSMEWYAYDVLITAINNPQFTYYVQYGNWSALRSLLNTVIGPQYDWYIAVVPYNDVVTITSVLRSGNYALIPMSVIPSIYYAPPIGMPIPLTSTNTSMLSINVYTLNLILGNGYQINTTLPLSNVAFIQCTNPLETNITQCIESGNVRMLSWWLEYFDPRTGVAVVWVNATGNIYMLVSNGSTPFNVMKGAYCKYPYCYPIGGISNFMYSTLNAPYNNRPQFIIYYSNESLQQAGCYYSENNKNNDMYNGSNYLVEIKTSGGTTPSGESLNTTTIASCTLPLNMSTDAVSAYVIGQVLTSIPDTNFTFGFKNVEVELQICFVNNTCTDYVGSIAGTNFPIYIGNIYVNETFGSTYEYLTLVSAKTSAKSPPFNYFYAYLLTLSLLFNPLECGIDVNTTIYDLVTMSSSFSSYFYNLTSNNGLNCVNLTNSEMEMMKKNPNIANISVVMSPGSLFIMQNTPQNPINGYIYVYNATTIIYDLWISQTPTTAYYMPITITYNFALIDKYNIVPPQYRERFPISGLAPTASAYAIMQLPNGTYYLVYLGLMSVTSG